MGASFQNRPASCGCCSPPPGPITCGLFGDSFRGPDIDEANWIVSGDPDNLPYIESPGDFGYLVIPPNGFLHLLYDPLANGATLMSVGMDLCVPSLPCTFRVVLGRRLVDEGIVGYFVVLRFADGQCPTLTLESEYHSVIDGDTLTSTESKVFTLPMYPPAVEGGSESLTSNGIFPLENWMFEYPYGPRSFQGLNTDSVRLRICYQVGDAYGNHKLIAYIDDGTPPFGKRVWVEMPAELTNLGIDLVSGSDSTIFVDNFSVDRIDDFGGYGYYGYYYHFTCPPCADDQCGIWSDVLRGVRWVDPATHEGTVEITRDEFGICHWTDDGNWEWDSEFIGGSGFPFSGFVRSTADGATALLIDTLPPGKTDQLLTTTGTLWTTGPLAGKKIGLVFGPDKLEMYYDLDNENIAISLNDGEPVEPSIPVTWDGGANFMLRACIQGGSLVGVVYGGESGTPIHATGLRGSVTGGDPVGIIADAGMIAGGIEYATSPVGLPDNLETGFGGDGAGGCADCFPFVDPCDVCGDGPTDTPEFFLVSLQSVGNNSGGADCAPLLRDWLLVRNGKARLIELGSIPGCVYANALPSDVGTTDGDGYFHGEFSKSFTPAPPFVVLLMPAREYEAVISDDPSPPIPGGASYGDGGSRTSFIVEQLVLNTGSVTIVGAFYTWIQSHRLTTSSVTQIRGPRVVWVYEAEELGPCTELDGAASFSEEADPGTPAGTNVCDFRSSDAHFHATA
jgi:hypothetical protein